MRGSVLNGQLIHFLFQSVREMMEFSFHLEFLPSLWKVYKTPMFVQLMTTFDNLTNVVLKNIDAATVRLQKQGPTEDHEMGVLEKLLQIDRRVALVMCYDMLIAGVDTVSSFSHPLTHEPLELTLLLYPIYRQHQFLYQHSTCWPRIRRNKRNCVKSSER